MSDDELPESNCPEFFLDSGGWASHGQTSSDVEVPATMAILGFLTLQKE